MREPLLPASRVLLLRELLRALWAAGQLQERLAYLGFLRSDLVTGKFTDSTTEAIRAYQEARGLRIIGVANRETQQLLEKEYNEAYQSDPDIWSVVDED